MRHGARVLLTIALLSGCGGATAATAARARPTGPDVGAPPGGNSNHDPDAVVETTTDAPDASAGAPVAEDEILVSGRGFAPQPVRRTGTAGATDPATGRDGATLDPSCVGTFPSHAQHVVKLGGPIDMLRVLVATPSSDLTLAVRTADGVWHCNDDSGDPANGLNPTVELYGPPPGQIEIWVGTYSSYYAGTSYELAVTEQPGYASQVLHP